MRNASDTGLFWLDDQRRASKYLGKQVSVTGVLDAANNLIGILTIQPADKSPPPTGGAAVTGCSPPKLGTKLGDRNVPHSENQGKPGDKNQGN